MRATHIRVHPSHPQKRLVAQAAALLADGGVLVSPTDACYSLICQVGHKPAEDRIRAIRHIERDHYFTLMCHDVADVAVYAKLENAAFRLIKMLTPGPYTFILPATRETPRRLQDPKRRMVGLRIPAHPFVRELLATLGDAVLASTLMDDTLGLPYSDPETIIASLGHAVDALVDAGAIGVEQTTIIDLTELARGAPRLVRAGKGDVSRVPELG
jgi:tRNA threonylcarbamoyl adenosine modification protein (Sua5/YciO/YrdC/YwlC family)